MGLILVLGGTRSGKSAHAETLAAASGLPVRYVGTAQSHDTSMAARISAHQLRRPADWETVEAGDGLAALVGPGTLTLIDGIGSWIAGRERAWVEAEIAELARVAHAVPRAEVIVVAEQAGDGLLPMDAVAREWLDLLGESVQHLSAVATHAYLVIAGRVLELPPVSVS